MANFGTLVFRWACNHFFFLLPFRVFELGLGLGAALVWVVGQYFRNHFCQELLLGFGIALILYALINIDDQDFFHPAKVLVPCIGACLVIVAGRAKYLGGLLSNPVSVWIGLISYSLYLIHWPLIVFWEYYTLDLLSGQRQIMVVVLSLVLASLMYKFIEQPFRKPRHAQLVQTGQTPKALKPGATFGLGVFALSLTIIVPSSNMWTNNGWLWRLK